MTRPVLPTLALVLLSAASSAFASPIGALKLHLRHTDASAPKREVLLVFDSETVCKRKVQVGGVVYTLAPTRITRLRVPAGTAVFSVSATRSHASGDLLLVASEESSGQRIVVD